MMPRKIINRVDNYVDSILLSLLVYLLNLYISRDRKIPSTWASVEEVGRKNIMSTIETLKYKKKLLQDIKEAKNEEQES